jgi:hypothetical protein
MKSFKHVRVVRSLSLAIGIAFAGLFVTSCTDTTDPGVLSSLVVSPNPATVVAGGTVQFKAEGTDFTGAKVTPTAGAVVWSVASGGGSINSSTGAFTASTTPGTYTNTIVATCRGISASATVVITPGPLASITVSPTPVTLPISATQQFTAVGKDAFGNVVAITPVWSASAGGTINATSGLFTAGTTPGTFTGNVVATSGTISGNATVTVTVGPVATITVTPNPATLTIGAQQTFTAVGKDAGGNVVPITPVWSVVNGGGTIVSTSGVFTAGTVPGAYINTVRATQGTIFGSATVNVVGGPVAAIVVTPNPATLVPGAQQTFTAVGTDAAGNVVPITPVWSVVNGGGTIDASTGIFTAGTVPGTYANTVKATQGTISGTATVIVTAGPATLITVTPNPATLAPGAQQTFTAVAVDASGNVVVITPVWSVANGGGTINSSTGVFTAGSTSGTFANTVVATSGTTSGTATVIVTPVVAPIATITVTPNPATVQVNGVQQFVAVARDAAGVVVPFTPVWSVTNGGGTINSATGLLTAGAVAGTFTNTVRATSGSIFGTATLIVTSTPPAPAPTPIVDLGAAAPNGIMAGTTITCITGGIINADIAISPGSTVTGFGPCVVTGTQHLADALAAQAQNDLTAAYNTLMGLPCPPANNVGTANIGGTTKAAGVYCSPSSMQITGPLTLDGGGDANAVFVFQAGSAITTAGNVVLINGAQAKNVYFVAGSSVTLGVGSAWQGNVIALSSITLNNNVTLNGRALARNGAVTLGVGNIITLP